MAKAAQKLLGAPTIGGGAQTGGGGGGSCRRQISPQHNNSAENRLFPALFGKNIAENVVFRSKVLYKIYSQDVFGGIH
jgi:hypothetical protein